MLIYVSIFLLVGISHSVLRLTTGWMAGVRFPAGGGNFLFAAIKPDLSPLPTSHQMDLGDPSPGDKANVM